MDRRFPRIIEYILLILLTMPAVYYQFSFFNLDLYFFSALSFFLPLGLLALAGKFNKEKFIPLPSWTTFLGTAGLPITTFYLFFMAVNFRYLLWAILPGYFIALVLTFFISKKKSVGSFLVLLTLYQIIAMLICFTFNPGARAYEFSEYGWRRLDRIDHVLKNKNINPIIRVEKSGDKRALHYAWGNTLFDDNFDPYMIQCGPGKSILISYERRAMLEKLDLEKQEARQIHFPTSITFFSKDNENPSICYTGESIATFRESSLHVIDTEAMKTIRVMSLYHAPWDTGSDRLDSFRQAFTTKENLFVSTLSGRIFQFDRNYHPIKSADLPGMQNLFAYTNYMPEKNSAYLVCFPLFAYRVSIPNLTLQNMRFLPLAMRILPIPENDEVVINGPASLKILDAETLKTKRSISTSFGIRSITMDTGRKIIFCAHYFSGELGAYDFDTGKHLGSFNVGPLFRTVHYCPHNDKIYCGSALGLFEIDPEVFHSKNN